MKVFKYEIPVDSEITIHMPYGAKILHVGCQQDTPCLWALVNPANPIVPHRFVLHGTGHDVSPYAGEHVGSFLMHQGRLVFHLFSECNA
jgi:hypothetical protein